MKTKILPILFLFCILFLFTASALRGTDDRDFDPPTKKIRERNVTEKNTTSTTQTAVQQKPTETTTSTSALTPTTSGPPRILTITAPGEKISGKPFTITATAQDPDDPLTTFFLKKGPYSSPHPWMSKPCNSTTCEATWEITENEGTHSYIVEVENIFGETDTQTIMITVSPPSPLEHFTFTTAAIDGAHYDQTRRTTYLRDVNISLTNGRTSLSTFGTPFATFTVAPDTLVKVSYTLPTHTLDDDYFFFDYRLPQCGGRSCTFTSETKTTACTPQRTTYLCTYTNTATNYQTTFTYIPSDPLLGANVIKFLNPLYKIAAPVLNFQKTKILLNEGTTMTLDLTPFVTDDNTPLTHLTWTVTPSPHVTVYIQNNIAIFTSKDTFRGKTSLSFTVHDPEGNSDTDPLLVEIIASENTPPTFTTLIPANTLLPLLYRETKKFSAYATDRDADSLTYTWKVDNTLVAQDTLHYTFAPKSFLPTPQPETKNFTITLEVTDGHSTISNSWQVHARRRLEYDPPTITNFTVTPNLTARNSAVIFTTQLIDASTIERVTLLITLPDQTTRTLNLPRITGDTYATTFSTTTLRGIYSAVLTAEDTYENTNTETIPFTVDFTPPTVDAFDVRPSTQLKSKAVTFAATIRDDLAIQNVYAHITLPDESILTVPLTNTLSDTYETRFTQTQQPGTYHVRLSAHDTSDNINDAAEQTFTIKNTIPLTLDGIPFLGKNTPVLVNLSTFALIKHNVILPDCSNLAFANTSKAGNLPFLFDSKLSSHSGCNTNNTLLWIKLADWPNPNKILFYIYHNETSFPENITDGVFQNNFNEGANALLAYTISTLNTTNITDSSNNSFTGSFNGQKNPTHINWTHGWAIDFRNQNYGNISTQRTILNGTKNITICMWTTNNGASTLQTDVWSEGNLRLRYSDSIENQIVLEDADASPQLVAITPQPTSTGDLICAGWGSRDGNLGSFIWWNGNLIATSSNPNMIGNGGILTFGAGHRWGRTNRIYDNIFIYDQLLSNTTIQQMYLQQSDRIPFDTTAIANLN